MDLLGLLQAGDVDGFNDARESVNRVELFAEELAGLKLHGVNLTAANLDKSDLTETDLTDATLVRAFLSDIDGTGIVLDGVLAMGVKMRDAWAEDADLTGGDFSRGNLGGAVLTRSKGEGVRMIGTRLDDAKADAVVWPLADLTEARLKGADFTNADLSRVKLTEAKGPHADFSGAKLDGADAASVNLGGAKLVGTSLRGARLVGASFAGADLTEADLSQADLSRANLTGANLTRAKLNGTSLVDACLDDAVLEGVIWDDADLTGVDAHVLGLADADIEVLAGHGARFDPDAALAFDDAVTAIAGDITAVAWMNPDDDTISTLRWALSDGSGKQRSGVLAVSGASVMAHTVLDVGDGFAVLALVDRPGGATMLRWSLSKDGEVKAPRSTPLGYEPAVLPVFRSRGDSIFMWVLARRGPMLIVHRDQGDEDGFAVIHTEARQQATGFFGRSWPVLAGKGGVLMTVGFNTMGAPRRTPEGFPARICSAVPVGDRILAVWNSLPRIKDPGGLRMKWIGGRHEEDTLTLSRVPDVNAIDAQPLGDTAVVAWTEDDGPDGSHVMAAVLPDGVATEIPFPDEPPDDVRVVPVAEGQEARVAVTTLTGKLFVLGLDGTVHATFGDT